MAAGRINSIDTSAAAALPGVRAVFTGADLNPISGPLWTTTNGPPEFGPPQIPLAGADVRFVGDPIAVVVASSRYIAEDACELIDVDVEATVAVSTLEDAMAERAALVHPETRDERRRSTPCSRPRAGRDPQETRASSWGSGARVLRRRWSQAGSARGQRHLAMASSRVDTATVASTSTSDELAGGPQRCTRLDATTDRDRVTHKAHHVGTC